MIQYQEGTDGITWINWDAHVEKLRHEQHFKREYQMSLEAFNKLVYILSLSLQRNNMYSLSSTLISPIIIIGIGIRYLAGGELSDIRHVFGVSVAEAYNCIECFIESTLHCDSMRITLPRHPEEWDAVSSGFTKVSHDELFGGCVGAVDGFFQAVTCPPVSEVSNQKSYYSGHYKNFGLNCQAICTHNLTFIYFGVVAPGSTNDIIAITKTDNLMDEIRKLAPGRFLVGDTAYKLMEHLLTPFTGSQQLDQGKDAFNFILSQVRIRIEMAFGRLTNKFRILKKVMSGSLRNIVRKIATCATLHNFIIAEDGVQDNEEHEEQTREENETTIPFGMNYHPTLPDGDVSMGVVGVSHMRDALLELIRELDMRHPQNNLLRNAKFISRDGTTFESEYVSPN